MSKKQKSKRKLFPFQKRVGEHLLAGRSVILQAPTGSGKTQAGLWPWTKASVGNKPQAFPLRCIYSVPMRTLANQFIDEYEEIIENLAQKRGRDHIRAAIQTGEQPNDVKFEQMLIFATLDQTLSSVLGIPYSLSLGQSNLNAGAVMSSYLVWDEFHLFGRQEALPTTLHLLQMLKGITPFCLMTATFSQTLLDGLAELLGAEVVTVPAAERLAIPSQKGKERHFFVVDEPLSARAVLETFNRRAIAICNTVAEAQALYAQLREQAPAGTEVRLLHSRFYQHDREATTQWVSNEFKKGWQTRAEGVERAILVSTQVIEVGMNITCEVLHSQLAPANTLIQRAGRCARFSGEHGEVRIYALPVNDQGKLQTAPYDMEKDADLCARTWSAFGRRNGQVLDYEAELQVLEEVHREDDAALLLEIEKNSYLHQQKMMQAMTNHDYQVARELIRDIDNRSLVIHSAPKQDELLRRSPWAREALSIPRSAFFRSALGRKEPRPGDPRAWLDYQEEELDWALAYPLRDETESNEQQKQAARFDWLRVNKKEELSGHVLFAVHPSLVMYDADFGLRLLPSEAGITEAPARERRGGTRENYRYHLETYAEHISGLWRACIGSFHEGLLKYPPLLEEMAYSLPQLAERCGSTPDDLMNLVKLVIAGHDVGKLAIGWQGWVKRWQTEKVKGAYDPNVCYAHTDYDGSDEHKALQRQLPSRPPHAAESAAALVKVLAGVSKATKANKVLLQAALMAITRHHTATHSGELKGEWKANKRVAKIALCEALEVVGLDETLMKKVSWNEYQGRGVSRYLVAQGDKLEGILAYLWLSRLLRMADQRSQQM